MKSLTHLITLCEVSIEGNKIFFLFCILSYQVFLIKANNLPLVKPFIFPGLLPAILSHLYSFQTMKYQAD